MKTAYIIGSIILTMVTVVLTWGFSSNWGTLNSNNKNLHQNNKNLRNDLDLVKLQVLQLKQQNNKLGIKLNKEKQKIIDNTKFFRRQMEKKINTIMNAQKDVRPRPEPEPTDDNSPIPSNVPSGGTEGTEGTGDTGESSEIQGPTSGELLQKTSQNRLTETNVLKDQMTEGVGFSSS